MLPLDIFKTVIASTPLISIDLIVRNNKRQVLLGLRVNRPAQGYWFVPGGRILKDESCEQAFQRLIHMELGLDNLGSKFNGIYQHFYPDNFSNEAFSTHYVVLAYEVESNVLLSSLPDKQHCYYRWFDESELLANDRVHEHTKWYFQSDKTADSSILTMK